jgi:hypothetical protein
MSLTKLEHQELCQIAAMLSSRLELNKDLPGTVFRDSGLEFYFFERPLLSNVDLLDNLLCSSFKVFSTRAFALFNAPLAGTCYLFLVSCCRCRVPIGCGVVIAITKMTLKY